MAVNAGAGIDGIIHQICPMVVGHIDWTASPRKRMKRCRAAKMAVAARYVGDPSYAVLAVAFKAGINTVIKGFNLVPRKNPVFWMLPGITRERVAVRVATGRKRKQGQYCQQSTYRYVHYR
jgi:hypothetical protein